MQRISFAVGIAYILFWVGMSASRIGSCGGSSEPFTVFDAVVVTLVVVFPFILGYQAGKEE